jgi:soluble lytic murein transglycosylase-like protein
MGFFDNFSLTDPTQPGTMSLLGLLAGLGQASAPSRLPVTMGSVIGQAAGGLGAGMVQGQQAQLRQQEITSGALKNTAAVDQLGYISRLLGVQPPSMQDITSGKYQGTLSSVPQSKWDELFGSGASSPAGGFGQTPITPTAPAGAVPGAPQSSGYGVGGALPRAAATYASQYGVDPVFYPLVINAESEFNPLARNPTPVNGEHATGVAQFLPSTARQYGVDPLNVDQSLDGGARYYADLLQKHGGNYVAAAQSYGTLPKDLSNLNPKQQAVYDRARALNANPQGTQVAQAGPMTATDAGGGIAAQPQQTGQSPQNILAGPEMQRTILGAKIKQAMGLPVTPVEQNLLAASMAPPGSPAQQLSLQAAMHAAGIAPTIGGERPGVPGRTYNLGTGKYDLSFSNPSAPAGYQVQAGPNGQEVIAPVPGGLPAVQGHATAQAAGPATFTPHTFFGSGGQPYQGTAAQLPLMAGGALPLAPQGVAAAPPMASGAPPAMIPGGAFVPGAADRPAQAPTAMQRPEAAAPTFPVPTPSGPKDISNISVNDLFPGGQGIPQPPAPPPGLGYGPASEVQKEMQKADVERLQGYNREASENQKIYQDLAHLRDVLGRGLTTGKLQPLWDDFANIAHSIGADYAIPKGYDPTDHAVFAKAGTDLVFAAVKKLAGAVRVAEITGYERANPNVTIPIEANYNIINDVLSAGKWQDARAKLANEFITQHPGAPLAAFDAQFNRVAPLAAVTDRYRDQMIGLGAKMPGQGAPETSGYRPMNQPPPPTAIGPNGHRLMWQNGAWFDAVTQQPFAPTVPIR